jgi:hypothetical protein
MTHISKNLKIIYLLLNALIVIVLAGCSARVADMSIISTKNIDLTQAVNLDVNNAERFSGEDCSFFLLNQYPFANKLPNLEIAVDEALNRGNGNVMVDGVTEESDVWAIIGNIKCIYAEGTVLNLPAKSFPY